MGNSFYSIPHMEAIKMKNRLSNIYWMLILIYLIIGFNGYKMRKMQDIVFCYDNPAAYVDRLILDLDCEECLMNKTNYKYLEDK